MAPAAAFGGLRSCLIQLTMRWLGLSGWDLRAGLRRHAATLRIVVSDARYDYNTYNMLLTRVNVGVNSNVMRRAIR